MKLNEDLAIIHAYLCADGYVTRNSQSSKHTYYRMGLRNTNYILLRDFQRRFERVWGVTPRLVKGERCYKSSKPIYEFLTKNFGSFYSWEWRMPNLNRKLGRVWLRAYYDCEGWVSVEKRKSRLIGVDCVNVYGLKQIQETLAKNGIKSRLKKQNTRNIYRMYIYGKDNLIKFQKYIGFNHPQKSVKLQEALDDYVTYDWIFPENKTKLGVFVRAIMQERAKMRSDNKVVRVVSIKKRNILVLGKSLRSLFDVYSSINKMTNGIGTHYYQLSINRKGETEKIIQNKLLNKNEERKWSKLKG